MCADRAVFGDKATAEVDGELSPGAVAERHDGVGVLDEVTAEVDVEEGALFGEEEDLEDQGADGRRLAARSCVTS